MEILLPIVQVKIDVIFILFISFAVGVLSGLFGIGGGFLMTPFLIFIGIPPVYAVPNEINNILATSVSGSMPHWFKNTRLQNGYYDNYWRSGWDYHRDDYIYLF